MLGGLFVACATENAMFVADEGVAEEKFESILQQRGASTQLLVEFSTSQSVAAVVRQASRCAVSPVVISTQPLWLLLDAADAPDAIVACCRSLPGVVSLEWNRRRSPYRGGGS